MPVTKANKLPEEQYLKMLDAAKYIRGEIVKLNKGKQVWRVYTEARKEGLRSKMQMDAEGIRTFAVEEAASTAYPDLDIQIRIGNIWNNRDVCIFIKVKS